MSHIMYALPVWGAAPKSAIGRLEKLQKKGIRFVSNSRYNAHTEPLFKKERVLKLEDVYNAQCLKVMHRKLHDKLHAYHTSKLPTNFEITNMDTKQKNDIYITLLTINITKMNSINYKVGTCWNQLDPEVRQYSTKSLKTFIRHLKAYAVNYRWIPSGAFYPRSGFY